MVTYSESGVDIDLEAKTVSEISYKLQSTLESFSLHRLYRNRGLSQWGPDFP